MGASAEPKPVDVTEIRTNLATGTDDAVTQNSRRQLLRARIFPRAALRYRPQEQVTSSLLVQFYTVPAPQAPRQPLDHSLNPERETSPPHAVTSPLG